VKKLLLALLATAALAAPAALADHGHNGHGPGLFGFHRNVLLAKVSGTGTSFAGATATASGSISRGDKLGTGTFTASITNDATKATTRTGGRGALKCMPATATVKLTGTNAADTTSATLSGKTCTWTPASGSAVSAFFGRGSVTGTGALASVTGNERAFFVQKSDGTVSGVVFAGSRGLFLGRFEGQFEAKQRVAEHQAGDCGKR
jgi:hypothetical protein